MNDTTVAELEMRNAEDHADRFLETLDDNCTDPLMVMAFIIAKRYPAGGWMEALGSYVSVARTRV